MKTTKLILFYCVCFAFVFVSCVTKQAVNTTVKPIEIPVNNPHRVAVNEDFLSNRKPGELERLNFYISADTEFKMYNNENQDSVGVDGVYYTNTVSAYTPVVIKKDASGKFVPNNSSNLGMVKVKFYTPDNKDILLTFTRVKNTNQYELDSATDGIIPLGMPTFQSDKPLLEIIHISGPDPDYSKTSSDTSGNDTVRLPGSDTLSERERKNDTMSVLGSGRLTENDIDAITDFICNERRPRIPRTAAGNGFDRSSVVQIIEIYFYEARREDINPDLAIAQMMWNLRCFSETKRYKDLRQTHNYGALDGISFNSRQIGIQAHIQFLRGLAGKSLKDPRTSIVLPLSTWNKVTGIEGTRETLEDISQSWVGLYLKYEHANDIRREYEKLFYYVSARRR